jgi:hypothetical protein
LANFEGALHYLDLAHSMFPEGVRETAILIDQANCLLALNLCEEAYQAASKVPSRSDEDMATLALQYMAECRMWQKKIPEALNLYFEVQQRLPCRLIDEERIQTGITTGLAQLEKAASQGKPF